MKKILLFGKLNDVLKDVGKALSEQYFVQICDLRSESAAGMINVVEPDLVVISLIGAQDFDVGLFSRISREYSKIPVLTIGTESEKRGFLDFYKSDQFENLIRPVENRAILDAVSKRLEKKAAESSFVVASAPNDVKTILVVDDNAVTLRTIRELIKDEYNVIVATSGMQAIKIMTGSRPDLVLLDYKMPICDGRQTLEMIRADDELRDVPVIFLTGVNDKEHIKAVLELKPQGYLLKPPSKDDLLVAIKKSI